MVSQHTEGTETSTDVSMLDPAIERFTQRHTYLDLDDIAYRELGKDEDERLGPKKRDDSSPTPPRALPMQLPSQQQQQLQQQNMPMPPQMMQNGPPMSMQQGPPPPMPDPWGRNNRDFSPGRGPPSMDGSVDNDRRRGGRGGPSAIKRRRSPSPPARGRQRRANSPPRISRHTPPDDFPEAVPWLMSLLPSKTVFAGEARPYSFFRFRCFDVALEAEAEAVLTMVLLIF